MEDSSGYEEEIDIRSRIKDISDRISLDRSADKASKHRQVSSAIGTETPIGVLSEIRESQERIISVMKDIVVMSEERSKREEQRHKEICTLLLGLNSAPASVQSTRGTTFTYAQSPTGTPSKSQYYYGSVALTSGIHAVSCVMMHLDMLLAQHPQFRKIQNTDKTFMDMKDWHIMCSNAVNADKNSKIGLRIPRPNDSDFIAVLNLMSSPVIGRRPAPDVSHISAAMLQAPELMNTVEWVRAALLRCSGSLSPERHCRFRSVFHPFVNENSELNVQAKPKLTMPVRTKHQEFLDLKAAEKKRYMTLILDSSFTPEEAMQRVRGAA